MTSGRCSPSWRAGRRSGAPAPRTKGPPAPRPRSSPQRSFRCRSSASEGEAQGTDLARGGARGGRGGDSAAHAAGARAARARVRPRGLCAARSAGGARARADHGDRRRDGRRPGGTRELTLVDPALAARVLDRALKRGGDMAELYAEARRGFALSLDDRRVERPQGGRERGACVRVVQGDSTYYGYVDGLAEDDLLRVAGSVSEAVRGDARHPAGLSAAEPAMKHPVVTRPDDVEAARKADLLRACDERARSAGPEVTQARIGYAESHRQVEACGSAPRSWLAATAASRPAATRAAATPAGSSWRTIPRRWPTRPRAGR